MGEENFKKFKTLTRGEYILPFLLVFITLLLLVAIILLLSVFPWVFLTQGGIQGVKDWLIPIFGSASVIAVAIGSWLAINEFRLKIETEKRISDSSLIESNVRLLTHFSEMMKIAHSRYDPMISEKVIEGLFEKGIITADDYKDEKKIIFAVRKLDTAILTPSYGTASQDAAIGAIYTLGITHDDILLNAAIEGLRSICSYLTNDLASIEDPKLKEKPEFKAKYEMLKAKSEMTENYLKQLENHKKLIKGG